MGGSKEENIVEEIGMVSKTKQPEELLGVELGEEEMEQVTGGIIWIPERDGTRKKKTP